MDRFKLYRGIYFVGVALIFIGGYRLVKNFSYGNYLFSLGVILYSLIQLLLLFQQHMGGWKLFQYLKFTVNLFFLISVVLLLGWKVSFWYYPFILGLLMDFFANILKKVRRS